MIDEAVARTYQLSRREATRRTALAVVWFLALLCCAIFFGGSAAIAAVLIALWPVSLLIFFEIFEATLDDEGVCEFRAPLRRKRVRVHQIRSINGGPSNDPEESDDVVIRYEGGRVRLAGEAFLGLLLDLVELNPSIKIDAGDGWFRRVLENTPQHVNQAAGDDPIRELRRSYDETIRREQRSKRLERIALFLFCWFFLSFMSLGLSPLVVSRPIPIPLAALIGGLAACVTWLVVSKILG